MNRWAVLLVSIVCAGCTTYTPQITLPKSPRTIPVWVNVMSLEDQSPPADRTEPSRARSATNSWHMAGNPAQAVERAVLADFQTNEVFALIRSPHGIVDLLFSEQRPDLLLTGTLYRFTEQWQMDNFVVVHVDLELRVTKPDGMLIRAYREHIDRSHELSVPEARAETPGNGNRLNAALTEAIQRIRARMLDDWLLFTNVRPSTHYGPLPRNLQPC